MIRTSEEREVDMEPADDRQGHGVVIRRVGGRWLVETSPSAGQDAHDATATQESGTDELLTALVLADLLADELEPGARPPRQDRPADEIARLTLAINQLEHALAARVLIEQAIGVLSERGGWRSREAFDRLRKASRSLGRRVHDVARDVVASVTDPAVRLPQDLPQRRCPPGRVGTG